MASPIRRDKVDPSPRKVISVPAPTHQIIKELADNEKTTMGEIVRYLAELASEGSVNIR